MLTECVASRRTPRWAQAPARRSLLTFEQMQTFDALLSPIPKGHGLRPHDESRCICGSDTAVGRDYDALRGLRGDGVRVLVRCAQSRSRLLELSEHEAHPSLLERATLSGRSAANVEGPQDPAGKPA